MLWNKWSEVKKYFYSQMNWSRSTTTSRADACWDPTWIWVVDFKGQWFYHYTIRPPQIVSCCVCLHNKFILIWVLLLLIALCWPSSMGNDMSVAWLPFYGQARLSFGRPGFSALVVVLAPAALSDSRESSCLSVVISLPGAALDNTNLSTVMLQNGSTCWWFDVCITAE